MVFAIENGYKNLILQKYEDANGLQNTKEKNGNYLWGKPILRDFKAQLCIHKVVKIIRKYKSWDRVKEETKKL